MSGVKCHHQGISRLRAEQLLLNAKEDGSFLIRDSESLPGAYTLCLLFQGRVHQYRVIPDAAGLIYVQAEKGVQERKFDNLASLVKDYLARRTRNGLVCALRLPVEVQEVPEEESDDEDEDRLPTQPFCQTRPPANSSGSSCGSMTSLDGKVTVHPLKLNTRNLPPPDKNGHAPVSPDRDYTDIDDMSKENQLVHQFISARFTELDLSSFDGIFVTRLQEYKDSGVCQDRDSTAAGEVQLSQLRQLLSTEAKELNRQLESFLSKIDICRQLFGPITTIPLTGRLDNKTELSLDMLMDRLVLCKGALIKLEKKAIHRLQELTSSSTASEEMIAPKLPKRPCRDPLVIPPSSFEAKLYGKLNTYHKVTLEVDIQAGRFSMVRTSKDLALDNNNVFSHDKVIQIIKSTTNNCRLDMRIDGHKGKDTLVFEDARKRESFCQLLQQMRFMHSRHQEVDRLSLFIGSWNMGDGAPPCQIQNWLCSQGLGKTRDQTLAVLPHDMYVIGTQESAMTEKEWVARLQKSLSETINTDLQLLTSATLWGIRLVILVKPQFKNKITHIQTSTVKTGIANALGNKGAAAISFSFNGTTFCFINCHLTSGCEKNNRRNQNAHDIIKGLNLGSKALTVFDITNQFHHVFFLGDLNYRLDGMDPKIIIDKIAKEEFKELLKYDQLKISQAANECFIGFREEEITFPPTYRIARGTRDVYEYQKFKKTGLRINAPSWCDRVLVKSYPETRIMNTSYGSVDTITTSDHKPVFCSYEVGIISQFASCNPITKESSEMGIIVEEVHAEVKTSTKEQFKLEFYSTCLESAVTSNHSLEFDEHKPGYSCPRWSQGQIPKMSPLVPDREYLEDQYILVAVKSADGMESYGEAVLALKSMFSQYGQPFASRLTHRGEETGLLTGKMYVTSKGTSRTKRRRSFELIYVDTDVLMQEVNTLSRNQQPDLTNYTRIDDNQTMACSTKPTAGKSISLQEKFTQSKCQEDHQTVKTQNSYESVWTKCSGSPNPPRMLDVKAVDPKNDSTQPPKANFKITTDGSGLETGVVSRKPRLGQSSLAPTTVLPATSPMAADRSKYCNVVMEYEFVRLPGDLPHRQPADLPSNSTLLDSLTTDHDTKCDERRVSQLSQLSSNSSIDAPPMPERNYVLEEVIPDGQSPAYDTLRAPCSVNQWLADLGLSQYITNFLSHGWDHLDFISDLTDEHLIDMDVTNKAHRDKILQSTSNVRSNRLVDHV